MKTTVQNINFSQKQQIKTPRGEFFIYGDGECFQRVRNSKNTGAIMIENARSIMGKKNDPVDIIATKI